MASVISDVSPDPQQRAPIETSLNDLQLPVRTLRVLQRYGCITIGDVLRLDLNAQIPGLGRKSLVELLSRLEEAGLPHAMRPLSSDIALLERNLERIEKRLAALVDVVGREIRFAKERIRRLKSASRPCSVSAANGEGVTPLT